ncbi:Nicotianamine synthase [Linum grandiflorum]
MGEQVDDHHPLVTKVLTLYTQISTLESLKPSNHVDTLFTKLVHTCMPPTSFDVNSLSHDLQQMRSNLINLCGAAEGHLESHFSNLLTTSNYQNPLHHLHLFPYYHNYLKLGLLEFTLLTQHVTSVVTRVAFVGSGPLPLTSIVLATEHLTKATFHNYDVDSKANEMAVRLVASDPDLSGRMFFHTADVMDVGRDELGEFDVVFLAALVGMDKEMKVKVIRHLGENMAAGGILMVRSAHGGRGFLYPVVDPCDLEGFDVLSVYHPTDEVINSVVVARKQRSTGGQLIDQKQSGIGSSTASFMIPCKCSEMAAFKQPHHHHGCMMEELTVEEQLS